MRKILLLGFRKQTLNGGDLQKIYARYGADVRLVQFYPKDSTDYQKKAFHRSVQAVLVKEGRWPLMPDRITLQRIPHILFRHYDGNPQKERGMHQILECTTRTSPHVSDRNL